MEGRYEFVNSQTNDSAVWSIYITHILPSMLITYADSHRFKAVGEESSLAETLQNRKKVNYRI